MKRTAAIAMAILLMASTASATYRGKVTPTNTPTFIFLSHGGSIVLRLAWLNTAADVCHGDGLWRR